MGTAASYVHSSVSTAWIIWKASNMHDWRLSEVWSAVSQGFRFSKDLCFERSFSPPQRTFCQDVRLFLLLWGGKKKKKTNKNPEQICFSGLLILPLSGRSSRSAGRLIPISCLSRWIDLCWLDEANFSFFLFFLLITVFVLLFKVLFWYALNCSNVSSVSTAKSSKGLEESCLFLFFFQGDI